MSLSNATAAVEESFDAVIAGYQSISLERVYLSPDDPAAAGSNSAGPTSGSPSLSPAAIAGAAAAAAFVVAALCIFAVLVVRKQRSRKRSKGIAAEGDKPSVHAYAASSDGGVSSDGGGEGLAERPFVAASALSLPEPAALDDCATTLSPAFYMNASSAPQSGGAVTSVGPRETPAAVPPVLPPLGMSMGSAASRLPPLRSAFGGGSVATDLGPLRPRNLSAAVLPAHDAVRSEAGDGVRPRAASTVAVTVVTSALALPTSLAPILPPLPLLPPSPRDDASSQPQQTTSARTASDGAGSVADDNSFLPLPVLSPPPPPPQPESVPVDVAKVGESPDAAANPVAIGGAVQQHAYQGQALSPRRQSIRASPRVSRSTPLPQPCLPASASSAIAEVPPKAPSPSA